MALPILKFKRKPKFPHKRSEGLTKRGAARQARLQTKCDHKLYDSTCVKCGAKSKVCSKCGTKLKD